MTNEGNGTVRKGTVRALRKKEHMWKRSGVFAGSEWYKTDGFSNELLPL